LPLAIYLVIVMTGLPDFCDFWTSKILLDFCDFWTSKILPDF
jgi:hypothetical protein